MFVIWKWTTESFEGVWKLQTGKQSKYVNMLPGGTLKLLGVKHSVGYWEKKDEQLCFAISNYGDWEIYNGNVHDKDNTNTTIKGEVFSGQTDSHYEGEFRIEPVFLQFHNIQYEADGDDKYHIRTKFCGFWLLENNLLTSDQVVEKSRGKMRKHIVKKVNKQEDSRIINLIRLNDNNTWHFCDVHLKPIDPHFKGTWGLYNQSDCINFNSAQKHYAGKGIWLKSNRFEKVFILTNVSDSELCFGICVESYGFEPEIDGNVLMRKI